MNYLILSQVRRENCNDRQESSQSCLSALPEVKADMAQVRNGLAIVFAAFAAVAILIIVIAAINFATSEGNPEKITAAKKTIIYALVGLVISLSAEVIVFTVLGKI